MTLGEIPYDLRTTTVTNIMILMAVPPRPANGFRRKLRALRTHLSHLARTLLEPRRTRQTECIT